MKVRWREHEMIFTGIAAAILLASYLWSMFHLPADAITKSFAKPFADNHVPFNFYRNMLLPQIGAWLVIYLTYLFVNLFTIPRLLFPKKFEAGTAMVSTSLKKISFQGIAKKILKEYVWLFIQILLIIFIAGTVIDVAIYYLHQWEYDYPGLPVFLKRDITQSPINYLWGYAIISSLLGMYAIYTIGREVAIHFIERPGSRRGYRILIWNEVTLLLIEYLLIPFFLISFHFIKSYLFFAAYFALVPPLFLVFMTNIYWLFPLKGEKPFFSSPFLPRLLLSTFLSSFPFAIFLIQRSAMFIPALLILWAAQLIIITPVSWLTYQHRKDKILQLRGAQKELVKSKADLQFLRSQINPHFLFNILNTLYGTALQENAGRTASGIQKLGDMMRFMLHENNLEFIQMSKEIEYLKNYIALQKLRTQSSPEIIIEENIREQNCNHKIAPMLLIPFVENAFKHGISLKEKSWVQISLECNEKNILFEVRNSMHAWQENDPEEEKSGIGFKNVLERLKLIYGGKFQISVNGDGKEFFVQLSIQL